MLRCLLCSSFFPLGRSTGLVQTSRHYGCQLRICTKYAGHCGRVRNRHYFGSQIVGGVIAVIMGIMVKKIRVFFPPLITGTVVFTIGLSLYPTAINYMAGGTSNPDYGSWQNWLVAFFTLAVVTVLNHFGKGIWKLSSILIGMLAGYVVSIPFGCGSFKRGQGKCVPGTTAVALRSAF